MTNSKRKLVQAPSPKDAASENAFGAIANQSEISEELIACHAYEKWQQRGCPLWESEQDWFAARVELEQALGMPSQQIRSERAA
ncbi:MAG TPA: DUF2934 domain-containing protein [Polyangiaceae bacterium]|jgi:hypothetical protein|nr:DUF2934 domain-containing protein [Polyangiaceae bacterium]